MMQLTSGKYVFMPVLMSEEDLLTSQCDSS